MVYSKTIIHLSVGENDVIFTSTSVNIKKKTITSSFFWQSIKFLFNDMTEKNDFILDRFYFIFLSFFPFLVFVLFFFHPIKLALSTSLLIAVNFIVSYEIITALCHFKLDFLVL